VTPEDDDLAALLRRMLHEEADRNLPAGDGLVRIRERVQERRRRLSWLRPVLVVATAAGVAAAAVAAPAILRQLGRGARPAATDTAGPNAVGTPSGSVLANPPPTRAVRTLPPEAGVRDMRTVWPYVSRAEGYYAADGDVAAGRHPELADATQAAVTFVQRYVGPRVTLTAGPAAAKDAGIGVVVNRRLADGTTHPVTRVYLVQVSKAEQAPYVVAAADRPTLVEDASTLTAVPPPDPLLSTADQVTVSGTVQRPGSPGLPAVQVEVGDAGGSALSFNRAVVEETAPGTYRWTASISLGPGEAARAVTLAAWTMDDDAGVLEFVATPMPLLPYVATTTPTATPTATSTATPTTAPTGARTPTPAGTG